MNRIDRLSAIIIQLQSRKTVRAQDIADRFQISLRTVYRDIRSLEEAGIPIIGEAGIGYSLMEGYRLPPVMFTREEATAFITAEKLVSKLTDQANSRTYSSAMDKVRAVLKTVEKDYLETIDDKIEVIKSHRGVPTQEQHNPLQLILSAIAELSVLELSYFSYYRQEQSNRQVEPVGVFYLDHYWHLIAYCRERAAYRDFRFDRIHEIHTTQEKFENRHPPLKDYLKGQYKDIKLFDVVIRIDSEAALHLGEQKYYHGYVSEKQSHGDIDMQFMTMSIEGFARWFMTFADYAVVVQPEALKVRVKSLFEAITKNFENS
jgi:predicted DNA-binding transcriptional regulator YafY